MLDFTSALYLGMQHPKASLPDWRQLSSGKPAALLVSPESEAVAKSLAQLLGCEQATLGTSTLHVFWDLFEVLAQERIVVYLDASSYPVARWGVERVSAKGVLTRVFPCRDTEALTNLLKQDAGLGARPVVVTDGLCPATGRTAPLVDYVKLVRSRKGYVVVDDTQSLGIMGRAPSTVMPYGTGGAGTAAWQGIQAPELITGCSLAKGFGVPIAVLGGSRSFIRRFESESVTRMHCSPPSMPLILAVQHALELNKRFGEKLRVRLLQLVRQFKEGLRRIGLASTGGLFPVQTLKLLPNLDAVSLHERLLQLGIRTVLHRSRNGSAPMLSFLITTLHSCLDIQKAINALQVVCGLEQNRFGERRHEFRLSM